MGPGKSRSVAEGDRPALPWLREELTKESLERVGTMRNDDVEWLHRLKVMEDFAEKDSSRFTSELRHSVSPR
jgi:hypothetical protein